MSAGAADRAAMQHHLELAYGTAPAGWWFTLLSGAAGQPANHAHWHRTDRLGVAALAAERQDGAE